MKIYPITDAPKTTDICKLINDAFCDGYRTARAEATDDPSHLIGDNSITDKIKAYKAFKTAFIKLYQTDHDSFCMTFYGMNTDEL